jgi:hypothetical protein
MILRYRKQDTFPLILIGNKIDREDRVVTTSEGEELAAHLGYIPFFEVR